MSSHSISPSHQPSSYYMWLILYIHILFYSVSFKLHQPPLNDSIQSKLSSKNINIDGPHEWKEQINVQLKPDLTVGCRNRCGGRERKPTRASLPATSYSNDALFSMYVDLIHPRVPCHSSIGAVNTSSTIQVTLPVIQIYTIGVISAVTWAIIANYGGRLDAGLWNCGVDTE